MLRMQVRASQGLGRGGGYFERSDPSDRRERDQSDERETDLDIFGRRRSSTTPVATGGAQSAEAAPQAEASSTVSSSRPPGSGPRNGLHSAPALPTKAERQKAALERLRNPKRKASLSPPRTRVYRDRTSRSRSREAVDSSQSKNKRSRGFIFSGGVS